MPIPSARGPYARRAPLVGLTIAPAVALALALVLALLTLTMTGMAATPAAAQTAGAPASTASTPPSPAGFVTDGAGFLSPATQDELEQRLARYERETGHQVLLWIGRTTGGEPIEPWAVRAFAAWRVGRKGLDDGVVIFIMADDRRVRIEVGYGVEDRLPDAVAARIIGDQMVPRLQAGDRDGAARAGVSGVLAALGGESGAPRDREPTLEIDSGRLILFGLVGLLVLGFLVTHPRLALMLLMTIDSHRGRGGWGGGTWGGGGFGGGFGGGGWGGGGFGGGGGFSGGGGRSGGGGASGSW